MRRRFWNQLHLWLSLPLGIVITLICFSGAMLVFENEITRITHADLFQTTPTNNHPLPLDKVAERVSATLPEGVSVTSISIFPQADRTYQVHLSKSKRASVYVDPYTGKIKGKYERPAFFRNMFSLHRWLLGKRPNNGGIFWGKLIVGISTLLFIGALLSGIIVGWPRTRKGWRKRLTIALHRGRRRFWYDVHVAGGMYAILFLLVMSTTGLTWSFTWYRNGFYKLFGVETSKQHQKDTSTASEKRSKPHSTIFTHWQTVYDYVKAQSLNAPQITLSDGKANVSLSGWGNQRASDTYLFDPRSGQITQFVPYRQANRSQKIRGWIYSAHVGNFGGWVTRLLWFLAALWGASLPLTGYYLWIKRHKGDRRK